ncbi:cytochrome P450 2U1-like [Pecten maximus]|uniref:cytochrome P450 2U1-like n=1 Tax=Pecten maximus TaxID=6579 RepID=UPI00145815AA|nr:cytochrome P450 2U1-like [Pecten maximus]
MYGNIYRLYYGQMLVVVLCGKENVHEAFVKQADVFSDRPAVTHLKRNELGIIESNGKTWKMLRRFALRSLRDLGVGKRTIEEKILLESYDLVNEICKRNEQPFSVRDMYNHALTNILHTILFGSRPDYTDPELNNIMRCIREITDKPLALFAPTTIWPFLKLFRKNKIANELATEIKAYGMLSRYIENQLEEHRSTFDNSNIRDFIDIFLGTEKNGSDSDITTKQMVQVIIDLFNAGTDTTSNTLEWAALYMISFPDVQGKCQQEIDEVVGQGRQVRLSDRQRMPYVEATLLEIQRIVNVASSSLPHIASRDAVVAGHRIPKGAVIFGNLQVTHMDSSYWDDPLAFKPGRFLDPDYKVKKYNGFMPFSVGPRACPGESLAKAAMFLIFSNTLQKLDLRKTEEDTVLSFEGEYGITVSPKPFELRAFERV